MHAGLYESLITRLIAGQLARLDHEAYYVRRSKLDREEAARFLAQFLALVIEAAFQQVRGDDRVRRQIELANRIIRVLAEELEQVELTDNLIEDEGLILEAVFRRLDGAVADYEAFVREITPYTRLSQSELFTGSHADLSLDSEIKKEIRSADTICWLVAFIKWSGVRVFERELREFTRQPGKRLRIITTSYLGATDARAIEFLAGLPNTEVKISYNTRHERLHAKAYLFLRDTGFHTGYIGSSNLSRTALTSGLEWNMKVTTREIRQVIDKFRKTFDTYWQDPEFEPFDLARGDLDRLRQALSGERSGGPAAPATFFDITPYPFQQEILDRLAAERRVHGRFRNLVVAATGAGKTVISAFDYRRFREEAGRARLLFVAHRKEILEQAAATFRGILRDNNFGHLWVDQYTPASYEHLFVSVQMLNNRFDALPLSPDYYDFIVVDEVHHIAADSYRPILDRFRPRVLLGLTATPERMDGQDILADFDEHIAAEIRLPEALERKLLCPFQYFGLSDSVDLSRASWRNGRYLASELTRIYTENDRRVGEIIDQMRRYLTDPHRVKALGFCASKDHARYMADKLVLAGFRAAFLLSDSSREERESLREQLRRGDLNYLFVVDIYNEGVDLPEIDTVLFLRPTESLTVFLQQLGRGLRLAEGKECLTVLDFVGNARPEYDFAQKFRALVGRTHTPIDKEIEDDFPHLPLGCAIVLERKAREYILDNIRQATVRSRRHLAGKIRQYPQRSSLPLTLANFLHIYALEPQEVYKFGLWRRHLADAGRQPAADFPLEDNSRQAIYRRWLGMHSLSYFRFLRELADRRFRLDLASLSEEERLFALMLHYDFWKDAGPAVGFATLEDSIGRLGELPYLREELAELLPLLIDRIEYVEEPVDLGYPFPLRLHSRYPRDHILAAVGLQTFERNYPSREGVAYSPDRNTEVFMVTLRKSEKDFSPTTMYEDYAISRELFHWQSQNSAHPGSGKGQAYLRHRETGMQVLLFVREQNRDEFGNTMPYVFLGPVDYVEHYGARPMSITWRLRRPMPSWLWRASGKMAVG